MTNFNEGGSTIPGYPRVKYRKVVIPIASVRTLRGTPYELVPSGGSFQVHLVHMFYMRRSSGTGYVVPTGADFVLQYDGGAGDDVTEIDGADFSNGSSVRRMATAFGPNTGDASKDVRDNHNLELTISGGTGEITGGSASNPLEVHIYYQTATDNS